MSEKPDGTVAWYQGDIDDGDTCPSEDHLLMLPNTVSCPEILAVIELTLHSI